MLVFELGVGVIDGFGAATTPLFQTSFFPDLIQVNFLPDAIEVVPSLEQAPPALATALAGIRGREIDKENIEKNAISLLFIYRA